MKYFVSVTVRGDTETAEFRSVDMAIEYVKMVALDALEGNPEDWEITFNRSPNE
jgi:hypothetical protein